MKKSEVVQPRRQTKDMEYLHGEPPDDSMASHILKLRGGAEGRPRMHFRLILENVMSIKTQDREDQLFAELRSCQWDFALVNETWRCDKEELWKHPEDGHLFARSERY